MILNLMEYERSSIIENLSKVIQTRALTLNICKFTCAEEIVHGTELTLHS